MVSIGSTLLAFAALCSNLAISQSLSCIHSLDIVKELGPLLANGSWISTNTSSAPRWSDYHAPHPKYVVHVAAEEDVSKTVSNLNANTTPPPTHPVG